ncbi:hypothetical protein AtNW77_Chr4g0320161 [Arabidopsis thaliana]|uniref:Uncharacterized protein n=2 Tax=Arabidopsis thaliana TaxID=3702 RepID=A0A654FX57_ARATH|nr:uncharacterized protein AT4G40063 [Arabidopsis thaliana]ANM67428.1 hypothetical protein AT4G40063 [Arabidopsis thaliana]CAA0398082.1 unnamed protein product [Arabidopsis thaliana]VYS65472.1 unnamed protein product [Arabidopsis thaliana]|eukprot:NP_001329259.1 hypothetical protein AT4G40063 [Arabidopsis thaliana]
MAKSIESVSSQGEIFQDHRCQTQHQGRQSRWLEPKLHSNKTQPQNSQRSAKERLRKSLNKSNATRQQRHIGGRRRGRYHEPI